MGTFRSTGKISSYLHSMSLWIMVWTFIVKMSCIIGWIGLQCLFPSLASFSRHPRRCILVWFKPQLMSTPKLHIVLLICLHYLQVPFLENFIFNLCISSCVYLYFHVGKSVRACQSLGRHILVLEPNMEVFTKVLEPLIVVDMLNPKSNYIHNFDNDYLVKKCSKKMFDCD